MLPSRARLLATTLLGSLAILAPRGARAGDDVPCVSADDCAPSTSPYAPAPRRNREFGTGTTHTWLELRGGIATFVDKSDVGPAFDVAYGVGFQWLDLGVVARVGSNPVSASVAAGDGRRWFLAIGPELAARWSVGAGGTLRLGIDPVYVVDWGRDSSKMLGADAIAQVLWTIDDEAKPVWRAGVGVRGGRWWTTGGEGVWNVGLDVIVRSWW